MSTINPCHHSPESCIPLDPQLSYNLRTYDFGFNDYKRDDKFLPENKLSFVYDDCHTDCRKVLGNTVNVANFVREFLGEQFILGKDSQKNIEEQYISNINVVDSSNSNEWKDAGWHRVYEQAVFGQRYINREGKVSLLSYGTDMTIVAHEFCHGLIQQIKGDKRFGTSTIRQMSDSDSQAKQPDALEESFCDILGILVRNYYDAQSNDNQVDWNQPHTWGWDVGTNFHGDNNISLRCLDTRDCLGRPIDQRKYHELSLIHSHAFYLFMATPVDKTYFFDGDFAVNLFGAVLENLSSDADFSKSRRNFESSAKILLRDDPMKDLKSQAISSAFDRAFQYL